MTVEEALRRADRDRAEITEVLYRYCRGVDRGDLELLRSVFHEDATDDHGIWKGRGRDFADFIVKALEGSRTSHMVSNVIIDLKGDVAFCESYCLAVSDSPNGGLTVNSRNVDRFERRDGTWRIADRLVVFDIPRNNSSLDPPRLGESLTWGRRDRHDPAYRR